METPRFSKTKKFLEFGLSLKFDSDEAKQRMIEQIMNSGEDGVFLGRPMIAMHSDNPFAKNKDLPIIFGDIESADVTDLDYLAGDNKILLSVETSVDDWVMDYEESEPRKVEDLSEEEQRLLPKV